MKSLQEVGLEILNHNPGKFYIFVGQEYGIKQKYIKIIAQCYDDRIVSANSVNDVLSSMKVKHFIPKPPSVTVIRYDQDFLSSLNASTHKRIEETNINGTIVCIYQNEKDAQKLDKFLGNYTVSIDKVSDKFIKKYLRSDFPQLNEKLIDSAILASTDYNQAQNICKCMTYADELDLLSLTDKKLMEAFGYKKRSQESEIRQAIARRSFSLLMRLIDTYVEGPLDQIHYTILNTMLELEKVLSSKYGESDLRAYEKLWSLKDVYNMFMNTYSELKKLRTYSNYDPKNSLIYLGALLHFREIPELG